MSTSDANATTLPEFDLQTFVEHGDIVNIGIVGARGTGKSAIRRHLDDCFHTHSTKAPCIVQAQRWN